VKKKAVRRRNWNEEHLAGPGVSPAEAEEVILGARSPFPLGQDDEVPGLGAAFCKLFS
jgi:hypothetical protein